MMARRGALSSFITAVGVTVLIVATSVFTAATVTVLASWSKELTAVVVIAGLVTAAGIAAAATLDR